MESIQHWCNLMSQYVVGNLQKPTVVLLHTVSTVMTVPDDYSCSACTDLARKNAITTVVHATPNVLLISQECVWCIYIYI